ncbi:MAG: photosystem II reaction center protein PsbN [Planctomycetota bacterium]
MAEQRGKALKIVIVVVCLAGAAFALYTAFGPSPAPMPPPEDLVPLTPEESGAGDMTRDRLEELSGGA